MGAQFILRSTPLSQADRKLFYLNEFLLPRAEETRNGLDELVKHSTFTAIQGKAIRDHLIAFTQAAQQPDTLDLTEAHTGFKALLEDAKTPNNPATAPDGWLALTSFVAQLETAIRATQTPDAATPTPAITQAARAPTQGGIYLG